MSKSPLTSISLGSLSKISETEPLSLTPRSRTSTPLVRPPLPPLGNNEVTVVEPVSNKVAETALNSAAIPAPSSTPSSDSFTRIPPPNTLIPAPPLATVKPLTPEELDRVGIPKKIKPDLSRSKSAPRGRVSFEETTPVPRSKWSETLSSEKNRESYIVELMSVGYHIVTFLEIEDFDKQKKYLCLCSSPRGFYVFCKLPKVTKPDESWIQIKYPKYEQQGLIQDIIDSWSRSDKFEGFIGLSDKAFCYIDTTITKFYQMLGNNLGDNLSKVKSGDYYLVPVVNLSQIVKDPGEVQNQVFETIKQLRIRTNELNQNKIQEIEDSQKRFKDNIALLQDTLGRNNEAIATVKSCWDACSDRKFFTKMDVLISSNSESCYRSFCEISKQLAELDQDINKIISSITVNSEQLKLLGSTN